MLKNVQDNACRHSQSRNPIKSSSVPLLIEFKLRDIRSNAVSTHCPGSSEVQLYKQP